MAFSLGTLAQSTGAELNKLLRFSSAVVCRAAEHDIITFCFGPSLSFSDWFPWVRGRPSRPQQYFDIKYRREILTFLSIILVIRLQFTVSDKFSKINPRTRFSCISRYFLRAKYSKQLSKSVCNLPISKNILSNIQIFPCFFYLNWSKSFSFLSGEKKKPW